MSLRHFHVLFHFLRLRRHDATDMRRSLRLFSAAATPASYANSHVFISPSMPAGQLDSR